MKKIIVLIVIIGTSLLLNAEASQYVEPPVSVESPDSSPGELRYITFYGDLFFWWTTSGTLVIECHPPFFETCYTLWWTTLNPSQKTVVLNDENQTNIDVTSDPSITIGTSGEKIHSFTR